MSSEVTTGQIPDEYGQLHPVETPELIEKKRGQFESELEKLPTDSKGNYLKAKEKCPELLTDDFKLYFLRCEVFNADVSLMPPVIYVEYQKITSINLLFLPFFCFLSKQLAAKRFVQYWDKRVQIFGPEKAFQPMTLSKALSEDEIPFSLGVMTLLSSQDPKGRSFVLYDPSKFDKSKYTTDAMVRTFWYVFHAALEREDTQKHGVIVLADTSRVRFSQFDRNVAKQFIGSLKGALPVRVSAFQMIKPPSFFNLILPIIKLFLPERLRKRIRFHSGSDEEILSNFEKKFGITRDMLPGTVGGNLILNHAKWLDSRRDMGL